MPDASVADGRILVVDDDVAILEIVADVLEFEGYQVETATDGAQALEAVEQAPPRLVLLDMRMPHLDGWAFARILRERGIRLPILVMTAARDASSWAHEIGAEGYLAKPFDIGELLDAVRGYTQTAGH
jgi:DNA-binding response OmpR family regulator